MPKTTTKPVRDSPYAKQPAKKKKSSRSSVGPSSGGRVLFSVDEAENSSQSSGTEDGEKALQKVALNTELASSDSDESLGRKMDNIWSKKVTTATEALDSSSSDDDLVGMDLHPAAAPTQAQTSIQNPQTSTSTNQFIRKKGLKPSVAHGLIIENKVVLVSLDLETGGESCGVIQLSAVAFTLDGKTVHENFDSYVKPPLQAQWNQHAVNLHGLHANHPSIVNADGIQTVWPKFVTWAESLTADRDQKVILIAWNGTTSDMKWIFRLTSQSGAWKLKMPNGFDYFCDPYRAIQHYKSCPLHPNKTGCSLQLPDIYKFLTERDLANAHNSLQDAIAQKLVCS